jgi:hypothetical protein
MRTADGEVVRLEAWGHVILEPGETIVSISSAGGGYGPPHERDAERVRHDVAEGWVSGERARSVYGVVLAQDGSVDLAATSARRAELVAAREAGDGAGGPASNEDPAAERDDAGDDPVLRLIEPGTRMWPTG